MARYRFDTTWVLEAPAAHTFDVLRRYETHPTWWQHVHSTRGSEHHGHITVRYEIQSPLLYRLRFDVRLVRATRPWLIVTKATGDLEGEGEWRRVETDGVTTVRHRWDVATTRPWMNALAPLAGPLFRWAHDRIMAEGAAGLANTLDARLLAGG